MRLAATPASGQLRVCPFRVRIDNREQLPYTFASLPPKSSRSTGLFVVPIERGYLLTGDYTIVGLEDRFALERKSLEDLYGTLGQHRERFEAEIQRLDRMDFAAILVEATLREVWNPARYRQGWQSKLRPMSVEGTIAAWSVRYPRVHWWTVGGRREGEVRAFHAMEQFWNHVQHPKQGTQS